MARFNIPRKEGFLCAGVITQAHSLRGEVLVKTFLEDESLIVAGAIMKTIDHADFEVETVRKSNKGLLIKFTNIQGRNDAEKARKTYLYIGSSDLPKLDDDELYYKELKAYSIVDEDCNELAKVKKAFYNGAAFIEIFQVFSVFWVISHLLGGGLLFCLYMIFYGCDKANNNSSSFEISRNKSIDNSMKVLGLNLTDRNP